MRKFQSSFYEGSELDNCDDKAFLIHKLWLLSGGGGVSSRHRKGVLRRHIIGGQLSVRLQQAVVLNSIKENVEGLGSRGLS